MEVCLSQTFTRLGSTTIMCPGGYLSAAGRAVLATGTIKRIGVVRDPINILKIAVYDAHDANGVTFRSSNRKIAEIDLTGATAMRQSVIEVCGTAITGGPSLSTYNKKFEFDVPPREFTGGAGAEYVGGQIEVPIDVSCTHGMIVTCVGSSDASSVVSIVYVPRRLGKSRHRRSTIQIPSY